MANHTRRTASRPTPRRRSPSPQQRHRRVLFFLVLLIIAIPVVALIINRCAKQPALRQEGVSPALIFGLPVQTDYIPEGSPRRPGTKRTIRYIVIHETANTDEGADAQSHSHFLTSDTQDSTSWHYTVDDHMVCHHLPDEEMAWHAGDREAPDGGNTCGIGVELCVNKDGNFEKTFKNGAKLTAYLLHAYDLTLNDVKQHHDFMDKNCPMQIRNNGRWQEFLDLVAQYYKNGQDV